MSIDQITTIITSAISGISIIFYFIITLKFNKKQGVNDLSNIISKIPTLIMQAKNIFGTNKLAQTNYILALIKADCEKNKIKFKQKQIEKAVKEEMEKGDAINE